VYTYVRFDSAYVSRATSIVTSASACLVTRFAHWPSTVNAPNG
jgi:hypothetical protein